MSKTYGFGEVDDLNARFEPQDSSALLTWAAETFGPELVVASSFGAEDIVLIDLAVQVDPNTRAFTLDTGRLHQETYDTIAAVRARFGIEIEVMTPDPADLEPLLKRDGPNGFYDSVERRRACCDVRKVKPLKRALSTARAWATGMRRSQNVTRPDIAKIELDFMNGQILKLNPLATWSSDQIWDHIKPRELPYNPLHDQKFLSIGCAPCTRAVGPGEDERAARWWWEQPHSKECGLHK